MKFKIGDRVKLRYGSLGTEYKIFSIVGDSIYLITDLNGNLQPFTWGSFELEPINLKLFEGEVDFEIYE